MDKPDSMPNGALNEFFYCDRYGLVRNYTMATDFYITAGQVERILSVLEEKIRFLEKSLYDKEKALGRVYSTSLE